MKVTYGRAIQWKDGEADLTGVLVMTAEGDYITLGDGQTCVALESESVLVAHGCTRELEFVQFSKISDYPSSPIPEPTR